VARWECVLSPVSFECVLSPAAARLKTHSIAGLHPLTSGFREKEVRKLLEVESYQQFIDVRLVMRVS